MNKKAQVLTFVASTMAFYLLAFFVLDYPVVQFSHETKECVSVIGSDEYDCQNLPEKYIHEWVK